MEKIKYILGMSTVHPVFVIGTGRSGTHWLSYSLGNHPEVRVTVETEPIFGLSTRMALDETLEDRLFKKLVLLYKWQIFKSAPRLYVDKTHPNIWLAEKLKQAFPQALFVGIERNPYATVASMMKHKGLSAWHRRWREFPVPNRFLGISPEHAEEYDSIPLASQCAIRWVAHGKRMNDLKNVLAHDLFVISYERFAEDTEETLRDLQNFLGLQNPIPIPVVKKESLVKWKSQLTQEELRNIESVVGFSPDAI